jgi:hypothetical protein
MINGRMTKQSSNSNPFGIESKATIIYIEDPHLPDSTRPLSPEVPDHLI